MPPRSGKKVKGEEDGDEREKTGQAEGKKLWLSFLLGKKRPIRTSAEGVLRSPE